MFFHEKTALLGSQKSGTQGVRIDMSLHRMTSLDVSARLSVSELTDVFHCVQGSPKLKFRLLFRVSFQQDRPTDDVLAKT